MKRLTREHTIPHGRGLRYRALTPAMKVDPGETIVVETINHMTPIVRTEADLHAHGSPQYREREETGPIFVRGAKPRDMLAVRVEGIRIVGLPHAHWRRGPMGEEYHRRWLPGPMGFPVEEGRCRLPGGIGTPVRPMIGDIYTMPPAEPKYYDHGGNMDFTEVRPGNTLYLPVYHEGGLLVLGDVHAAQGDGELLGEGAETAADVTVTVNVDRRYGCARPVVETPDSLITIACRGSLYDGLRLAVEDMVGLLSRVHGFSEADAYVLCGLTGSVRLAGCLSTRQAAQEHCIVALSVPRDFD